MKQYCVACHSDRGKAGDLSLADFDVARATDHPETAEKIIRKLRAGVIWANTYNRFDPTSPFGGYKESGFGREGGLHGLAPYLDFE